MYIFFFGDAISGNCFRINEQTSNRMILWKRLTRYFKLDYGNETKFSLNEKNDETYRLSVSLTPHQTHSNHFV